VWSAGASLYLHLNGLEVGAASVAGAPTWTSDIKIINLNTPIGANAVALAHAYMPPGGSTSQYTQARSTFYVAVVLAGGNQSRVLAVSPASSSVIFTLNVVGAISAMTVMPRANNGVHLYIGRNGDAAIKLYDWTSTIAPPTASGTDELFFSNTNGGAVLLTPVLWPSLSALFFALAPMPSDPIRYRDYGRPRRRLLVADMVQRTMVSPQGLHPLTAPVALAVTGRGQGLALIVAASEDTLFLLEVTVCVSLSDGIPRYYDGATCQPATCARSRSCQLTAGRVWDRNALRCVCMPGYYGGTTGACTACPIGQYCPGNTPTGIACPATQTSLPSAIARSDCLCPSGQYYNDYATICQSCPSGYWCPNRWTRLPCPGMGTNGGYETLPSKCSCMEGFAGVGCTPCPSGFICPLSLRTATDAMVQMALAISLPPQSGATACSVFYTLLASRFSVSTLDYLKVPETLERRLLCTYVPAPTNNNNTVIKDVVVIMVLANRDHRNYVEFLSMGSYLSQSVGNNNGNLSILSIFPSAEPAPFEVFDNTPTACRAGYVPSPILATQCVCASGFASSSSSGLCSACPAGQFKTKIGAGTCAECPTGTTSSVGASTCIAFNSNGNNNNGANGNRTTTNADTNTNVAIIAGSVGGGVLLVGFLVWGFVAFSSSTAT
jgi:hypothetical protein